MMDVSRCVRMSISAAFLLALTSAARASASSPALTGAFEEAGRLGSQFSAGHQQNQLLLELYRNLWRLQEERGTLQVALSTSTRARAGQIRSLRYIATRYPSLVRDPAFNPLNMTDEQILRRLEESPVWSVFFTGTSGDNAEQSISSSTVEIQLMQDRLAQLEIRIAEIQRAIDRQSPPR